MGRVAGNFNGNGKMLWFYVTAELKGHSKKFSTIILLSRNIIPLILRTYWTAFPSNLL